MPAINLTGSECGEIVKQYEKNRTALQLSKQPRHEARFSQEDAELLHGREKRDSGYAVGMLAYQRVLGRRPFARVACGRGGSTRVGGLAVSTVGTAGVRRRSLS
jgi:hypothetical protein